jgi:D-alanine-D-alanine ligase-like ATP-grasp enzyme
LSVLCEHYLIGTLTAASAIELLLLAEEYVIPDLRTEALTFIRANLRTVVAQARFPDLPGVVVKDILQMLTAR